MFSSVISGAFCGIDSYLVKVEVDVANGLPCMDLIGCLSKEAAEAKERIRVALKNIGIHMPPSRITINLSPADRHKSGTGFDLPAAVGLLCSTGHFNGTNMEGVLFAGELGLNGEVKPVRGILPIVRCAVSNGIHTCVIPKDNTMEAAVIDEMKVYGVSHMDEVINMMISGIENVGIMPSKCSWGDNENKITEDFYDISGQEGVKRAAQIAAAGFHHMLLIGPPGSGKTMIARRLPSIMPPLSLEESLEVSTVYSVCGRLKGGRILEKRPFMAPHHTTTANALVGGGNFPRPGAVSLAHRGVLFLDEFTEFKRSVLEVLRQPLEDRKVQIARIYGNLEYPSDFLLVAAMNPCPCGYYPDKKKCHCPDAEVKRYLGKISGPILDRVDMCVEAPAVELESVINRRKGDSSDTMRKNVERARLIQTERFKDRRISFNSQMEVDDIERFCIMDDQTKSHLSLAMNTFGLSVRAYHKILRTARTIADLSDSEKILPEHVNEAVFYRTNMSKYWSGR